MSLSNENDINNVIIPGTTGLIEALAREANDVGVGQSFQDYLIGTRRVMLIVDATKRGLPLERVINNKARIPSSKERENLKIDRKQNYYEELVQ